MAKIGKILIDSYPGRAAAMVHEFAVVPAHPAADGWVAQRGVVARFDV